jgi:hypothetical protein
MRTVKASLNEVALANSFAVVAFVGFIICVIATIIFPEFLMSLFNSWFHGVDLSLLSPANGNWVFGTGNLLLGLLTFPVLGWVTGYFIASLYNKFNK